jgi:DNA-binding response OmpR family regulator
VSPATSPASSAAAAPKPRLLVVEDHPDLRRYLVTVLAADYDVLEAADGLQGLAIARTRRPDVVLADVMMPRLDGNGLVQTLRSEPATAEVPVVLLSALAGADARAGGIEGGADDFLVKPFDLLELQARLAAVLRRPAQHDLEARERRDRATAFASELAASTDLEQVVVAAVAGFSILFDGAAAVRVTAGKADLLFTLDGVADPETLPGGIRDLLSLEPYGAASRAHAPAGQHAPPRIGLLLTPSSASATCRVWVQFSALRPVGVDEEIVGDLLARSFAQAVDRVLARRDRDAKEQQLRQAIESHRSIGQAVGVLIERHKVTAVQGFEMLRQASLHRNIKLRELAARVVESGEEPMHA